MRYRRKPKLLSELLDSLLKAGTAEPGLKRGMVLSVWSEKIGAPLNEHIREVRFQGDRLVLFVRDPSWRHEIHMQRHAIARSLNEAIGEKIIHDIVTRA